MSEQTPHTSTTETINPLDAEGRVIGFWEKNSKKITAAALIVIIAIGGFFAYKYLIQVPKEEKAAEAMFRAEDYFRQDSLAKALNGDGVSLGFLKIIERHGGTDAGNLAHYYAGAIFLKQGDFANAMKHLDDFNTSSPVLKSRKLGLMGDAASELGKKEEAVTYYKQAGTAFTEDVYFSSEYTFRAGFLLESMGKTEEAIEQYRTIKEKYPDSQRGYDIDKYLARLGEVK